jgi:hypothetical protein
MARTKRYFLHGYLWHLTHCKRLKIRFKDLKIIENENDYQLLDRQIGYVGETQNLHCRGLVHESEGADIH